MRAERDHLLGRRDLMIGMGAGALLWFLRKFSLGDPIGGEEAVLEWQQMIEESREKSFGWGPKISHVLESLKKTNLGEVRVRHDANNSRVLREDCENQMIDWAELDLRLVDGEIVCQHDVRSSSQQRPMLFCEALGIVGQDMGLWQAGEKDTPTGLKLDVKEPEVLGVLVEKYHKQINDNLSKCGFVLNGDVLAGPGGSEPRIDGSELIRISEEFDNCVLSLSFTTGVSRTGYTDMMMGRMAELVETVGDEVLLPVKAGSVYARSFLPRFNSFFDGVQAYPYLWSRYQLSSVDIGWVGRNYPAGRYVLDIPNLVMGG